MEHKQQISAANVPIEVLLYQNRQLGRLVRHMRSGAHKRDLVSCLESSDSKIAHLVEENERLLEDKRALYTRLEKLSMTSNGCQMLTPPTPASQDKKADAVSVINHDSATENSNQLCVSLEKELIRVKNCFSLQDAKDADNAFLIDTLSKDIVSLQEDKSSWMAKATSLESLIGRLQRDFTQRLGEVISNTHLAESTYLKEMESMSQENAMLHQSLRKSREETTLLESLNKLASESQAVYDASIARAGSNIGTTADDQVTRQLQENLIRIQGILKSKDEQVSRILSQHVQLQQTIARMEQENALMRIQLGNESMDGIKTNVSIEFDKIVEIDANRCRDLESYVIHSTPAIDSHDSKADEYITRERHLKELVSTLQYENGKLSREVHELERIKAMLPVGGSSTTLLGIELEDLKSRIRCSLCEQRDKNVVLISCMHCFCRGCVDEKMLNARNRKCPLCNQRFSDADVKDVHFLVR